MWDDSGFGYVWRQRSTLTTYAACDPITLSTGTVYLPSQTLVMNTTFPETKVTFSPQCPNGSPVTDIQHGENPNLRLLNTLSPAWTEWINGDGSFRASLLPLLYSISICMFISWLLLIATYTSTKHRPLLQKLSMILSCVYLTLIFGLTVENIKDQHYAGYLCTANLARVFSKRYIVGICLGFNVVVLFSTVQTTMGLFPRKKDKQLVLLIGGLFSAVSQILWGVSIAIDDDGSDSVLPAFVYLLQVALAILYASCVIFYTVAKWQATLHKSLLLFTTFTLVVVILPVALFMVDVNGWWIINWVDSVSWTTTLLSVITVWEWSQYVEEKYNNMEQSKILGYQIYDDHYYHPDVNGDSHDICDTPSSDKQNPIRVDEEASAGTTSHLDSHTGGDIRHIRTLPAELKTPTPTPPPKKLDRITEAMFGPMYKVSEMISNYFATPATTPEETEEQTAMKLSLRRAEWRESAPTGERHFHPIRRAVRKVDPDGHFTTETTEDLDNNLQRSELPDHRSNQPQPTQEVQRLDVTAVVSVTHENTPPIRPYSP